MIRLLRKTKLPLAAAALWLLCPRAPAQSPPAQAEGPASNDRMTALESRIDRLAQSLAAAEGQVEDDHRKMQSMQAEIDELRKQLGESGAGTAPEVARATSQLQQAVTQIRDEQEVIASQVQQHEQTKVESASKLPVRFHGLVLFNAYVNEGVVDNADLPTSALERTSGQSHGSVGGTVRQTMLSFEGRGPALWNGRFSADAALDFFGGVTSSLSAPSGIARLRTGGITWQSSSDLVRVGYDGPLISPLSPASIATVAQPSLAWSGNLWAWAPQLRYQHRFAFGDDREAGFELGFYDAAYASSYSSSSSSVSPGEAARQPGYETRWSYRAGKDASTLQLGVAGYYDRKNYGYGQTVDAWAGATDWRLPVTKHANWSGEFYRGRGIGSLGGGAYRDAYTYTDPETGYPDVEGLDSTGGWTQWQLNFTETMQLNFAGGQDTGYASELRQAMQQGTNPLYYYARNRSLMANFIYRPWSSFLLSPEFRRINSWPTSGSVQWANVYTLSAGYEF